MLQFTKLFQHQGVFPKLAVFRCFLFGDPIIRQISSTALSYEWEVARLWLETQTARLFFLFVFYLFE
jgi:hypothetical protein